eukprot:153886_1
MASWSFEDTVGNDEEMDSELEELLKLTNMHSELFPVLTGMTKVDLVEVIHSNSITDFCKDMNMTLKQKIKFRKLARILEKQGMYEKQGGMYKPKIITDSMIIITAKEQQKIQELNCTANKLNSIQSANSENNRKILQQSDKMTHEIDKEFTQMINMLRTKQQQLHAKLENAKNENYRKLQITQHHLKHAENFKSQQQHLIMNEQLPITDREKLICQITDKIVSSIIYEDLIIKKPEFSLMSNVDAIKQNIS